VVCNIQFGAFLPVARQHKGLEPILSSALPHKESTSSSSKSIASFLSMSGRRKLRTNQYLYTPVRPQKSDHSKVIRISNCL